MYRMTERTNQRQGAGQTSGGKGKDDALTTQDADQAGAQQSYMQGLRSPADRARSAIRASGLPIDHLIPDSAVAFQHKKDGSFTLKLAGEVKIKIDNVTLVLTQSISGKLGSGKMDDVKGIYGVKKVMFFTGRGNILTMAVKGTKFVVTTDNSNAESIEFSLDRIRDVKV